MAKVLQTLRKKAQATPVVGVILDSLKSENPRQNAPSIQAVLDNLRPRQLLINGDFQVWQRGTTISLNDTDTTTNGFKYFADMWCTYFERGSGNSYKFEKVSNGVKVTCSKNISISQFVVDPLDNTKDYTFVVSINGTVHTLTFKGQETKENEFIKHMNTTDTASYNRLIINVKNNDIINYADLFEGDIDYPHVKEDKAIALMRCQRYVVPTVSTVMGYTGTDSRYVYVMCEKLKSMADTPTVTNFSEFVLKINGTSKVITINNATANVGTGEICLDVGIGNLQSNITISGFMNDVILTCEPL